jgi:glycosyltransferase involved in cell wall biosynthesis
MPVISIIVPVYKTEEYLKRCVDSILAQTFTDFECILIDDGSPDNCGSICDEYAKKDSRIIVIHQENAGVSAARNAGLDKAQGEWIGFVDSDDWCDADMFRVLHENAIKYYAEVSICGIIFSGKKNNSKTDLQIFDSKNILVKMFTCKAVGGYSFNKLIRSDIFSENNLRYDTTIPYMEDVFLFYELFKHVEKIVYNPKQYYNYFYNSTSVTNQFGLTEKARTAFAVLDRIILMENNIKIKKSVIFAKITFAYDLCKHYVIQNDCTNKNFLFLKKIISNNGKYLLFDFSIPLKKKILCFLIFFPCLYRKIYYYSPI